MRLLESAAKTVEEAIEKGLQELGASIGDVEVQVLEEGSKGLFGLFGSRMAKVRLTLKAEEEDPLGDLISGKTEEAPAPAVEKESPVLQEHQKAPATETPAVETAFPEEKAAEAGSIPAPAPVRREPRRGAERKSAKKQAEKKQEAPKPEGAEADEEKIAETEPVTMEKPEVHMIPEDQLEADSPAGVACAFLKELTRLMNVNVTVDMGTDDEGNVYGFMSGDTLGILIGRRGETLDALQYLTSLKVNRGQETYTRVTLDTENYRAKREDTLIRLANRMANRAVRTGRRVSLEPMNPYERRIIHFALQKNDLVDTHSEGDEPNRHVVITLKK